MYLNILLKRKKEPTHHFSFNGSTTIKTDKEHIHRGFKDHHGLGYSFNGPTKITTDNKLLYKGFTKNYTPSRFHHSKDDNEYLKNFNLHPTTKPVELFTEYKNRYPKLSDNEYSIEQWQTEQGTPNTLNRFMRQDKTGRSIETIEADDNDYRQGLEKLEEILKTKRQAIIDDKDNDSEDKRQGLKTLADQEGYIKKAVKKYANPVTIKPAIKKDEKYTLDEKKMEKALEKDTMHKQAVMDKFARKVKKGLKTGSTGVEESKSNNEPKKATITLKPTSPPPDKSSDINTAPPPPPTPLKSPHTVASIKKKIDDLKGQSRPTSPIAQTKKQLEYNSDEDSDSTTVNNDTVTVVDELKPIYLQAQKYLEKFENEKNSYNLFNNNKKAYEKLNKFMSDITGKPSDIKKLKTFRQKLLVNFS